MVLVIILKSQRVLAVKNSNWIEEPVTGKYTRFYYSPNPDASANFKATKKYLFDENSVGVYDCYVIRHFGKYSS